MDTAEIQQAIETSKRKGAFWRGLALVQVPVTAIAVFLFLANYFLSDTIVSVPERKPSGHYAVDDLPDREFINLAVSIVNSLASFQPATARMQFETARDFIAPAYLQEFDETQMKVELSTAEQSSFSQVFYIDSSLTSVRKDEDQNTAVVRISGVRNRFAQNSLLPAQEMSYRLTLTPSGEPSETNRYGLQVAKMEVTITPLREVAEEVKKEKAAEAQRKDLKVKRRKLGKHRPAGMK